MVKRGTGLAKPGQGGADAAPPKPAAGSSKGRKGPFDRKTLRTIREQLSTQREELLGQLHDIEETAFNTSQSDLSGEVSYDEDFADAGSFTFEREKDLSIAHNVRDLLEKMAKALEKIDEGTYGLCESCGQPIDAARVKALPHVLLCLTCKKAEERR
jgi:DnaK suppressor protein